MDNKIKVKVLNPFINKYSKEVMQEGQILEITENRLKEIEKVSLNFVQVIEENKPKEEVEENKEVEAE